MSAAPRGEIRVLPDAQAVAREAAERFVAHAARAVAERGRFTVALAGGGTPRLAYRTLARPELAARVPWERTHVLFGDERAVPPGHPRSNYRMAREALLDHVPIPAANVHRIRGELGAARAAARYAEELAHLFDATPPRLDLVHLGAGADGHTASLFPFDPLLHERDRIAASTLHPALAEPRVTLTLPVLDAARAVEVLLVGAGKADIARELVRGALDPVRLPAQAVRPSGGALLWLLDEAAAARL